MGIVSSSIFISIVITYYSKCLWDTSWYLCGTGVCGTPLFIQSLVFIIFYDILVSIPKSRL